MVRSEIIVAVLVTLITLGLATGFFTSTYFGPQPPPWYQLALFAMPTPLLAIG